MSNADEVTRFDCVLSSLDENPKNPMTYLGRKDGFIPHKGDAATGGMKNSFKNHPIDIDSDGNVVQGFVFRR